MQVKGRICLKSPVLESLLYVVPAFTRANSKECRLHHCMLYSEGFHVAHMSDWYILVLTLALRGIEQSWKYSLRRFLCIDIATMGRMTWRWLQVLFPSTGGCGPCVTCLHMGSGTALLIFSGGQWSLRYLSCGVVVPALLAFTWGSVPCVPCLHVGQWSLRYLPSGGAMGLRYLPSRAAVFPVLLAFTWGSVPCGFLPSRGAVVRVTGLHVGQWSLCYLPSRGAMALRYLPSRGVVVPALLAFTWGIVPCGFLPSRGAWSLRYLPSLWAVVRALLAVMWGSGPTVI
jgi:hypothetical protein